MIKMGLTAWSAPGAKIRGSTTLMEQEGKQNSRGILDLFLKKEKKQGVHPQYHQACY